MPHPWGFVLRGFSSFVLLVALSLSFLRSQRSRRLSGYLCLSAPLLGNARSHLCPLSSWAVGLSTLGSLVLHSSYVACFRCCLPGGCCSVVELVHLSCRVSVPWETLPSPCIIELFFLTRVHRRALASHCSPCFNSSVPMAVRQGCRVPVSHGSPSSAVLGPHRPPHLPWPLSPRPLPACRALCCVLSRCLGGEPARPLPHLKPSDRLRTLLSHGGLRAKVFALSLH